ncbi:hypothetical protein WOLCODRAFT_95998 [Wolfiporia cocos MD-104 SS10]|uniref:Uncharacterized protein n=1 Tax=Wolfiporia cocos (strain MD-104) TaxID=742152 RepID=A0A2H3J7E8_WOLCO|nr:hypothetical protein WOLCODRAFT_95998 [Wolfiporia cocos MD-104 SS10]
MSSAINGGVVGAVFFSFREYIASPALLSALSDTSYPRRIRELKASREMARRSGDKLTYWDMRLFKIPDTLVSGAFTGGVLNVYKRGPAGLVPGATTAGLVCTFLQLAFNEFDIARVKYVSRRLQEPRESGFTPAISENTAQVQDPEERPKSFLERMLIKLGGQQVSDEEYLDRLKYKRDHLLQRIAELEKERETEESSSKPDSSKPGVS